MKILIDILHPAHVNVFRNFIREMTSRGHAILVTAREKDVAIDLLDAYAIPYIRISAMKGSFLNLGLELMARTWRLARVARQFKPDLMIGAMGPSIALAGKMLRIPTLVFYNNETAKLTNRFVYRLATRYITSTSYEEQVPGHHVTYPGYQELAYLHPNRFTPDPKVLGPFGVDPGEKYFILRFVSWQSSHDLGARGFEDKAAFVQELSREGRVWLTSEKPLPPELTPYQIRLPPQYLSDAIAFAHFCAGESASVTSDAACLGVPAIYLANTPRGYTNEQERKYGLVFNYQDQPSALRKALELARRSRESIREEFQAKRARMLSETVDLTDWMIRYVEEFQEGGSR